MTHPVLVEIIRGESLTFEVRLIGEDLDGATPSIATREGIPYQEIILTIVQPDTIQISAPSSSTFLSGKHDANLWVEWPDDFKEVVLSIIFVVKPSIDIPSVGVILDGGAPDTVFLDEVDGGEA